MKAKKKTVVGAFLGTIVEYYDYSLYGFSAAILADKFFPGVDKTSGLMYVFFIYALSYLAKPFGSIFFSRIGDKYGRKISLRITMIGIAIPTLTIGLLPDYNSIGLLSAQILVICRFFQGFFVAGEYDGAAIYVIEHMGSEYRYTASAATRATGVAGLLLGIASTNFFNASIFPDWCWRIPFLLSMPLALITIYYRKYLEETPDFIKSQINEHEYTNICLFLKRKYKIFLMVVFLSGGFGATYQISIIFMKQYLPLVIPQTTSVMTLFSVITVFVFGISMMLSGLLADKIGSRKIFKVALFGTILSAILLAISINHQLVNLALASCLVMAASIAPFNALAHASIIKTFLPNERYRGISLGHTTGSMLMSGTANAICLYFMGEYKLKLLPIFYVVLFASIAYCMLIFLKNQELKND